jgi:hypothetical protein
MFDKIGRYAESVATRAGQSRRGFLRWLGQAALGAAGITGALLLFPGRAHAFTGCQYACPDGTEVRKDCPCGDLSIKHKGMTCILAAKDCPY